MEATICFPALSTEVIADGWHLDDSLLRTAFLLKGEKGLCLVTDSMRAVDMPDGEYWFGPKEIGTLVQRRGEVGVTLDGTALASGVMPMDHAIRIMMRATGAKLPHIIRLATLNPARMLALHDDIGSLEIGKWADVVTLNESLGVERKIWHAANGRAYSKSNGTVRYYPATDCNGRMHVCVMPASLAFIPPFN